jgi:hypothetical protein
MTSVLGVESEPIYTVVDEMERAFHCEPQVCEDSLQFLCMRWTTGSPECRGLAPLRTATSG